jgi:hypothetical protein
MVALTEHANGREVRCICFKDEGGSTEYFGRRYCRQHDQSRSRKPLCFCAEGSCLYARIVANLAAGKLAAATAHGAKQVEQKHQENQRTDTETTAAHDAAVVAEAIVAAPASDEQDKQEDDK